MRVYLTEFIGTFFLVLTIGLTVLSGSPMAPLAIGLSLMVMVYAGGHISGAHYNPAVSLAAAMAGALPMSKLGAYMASQVLGATAAAFAVFHIVGQTFAPTPGGSATAVQAMLVEVLYTFALALVVLNTAVAKKVAGNSYFGLAIGLTVTVGAFAGGAISGGAFNPAVGFGPTFVHATFGSGSWSHLWLYLVGPFVGGALAAVVFGLQDETPRATAPLSE